MQPAAPALSEQLRAAHCHLEDYNLQRSGLRLTVRIIVVGLQFLSGVGSVNTVPPCLSFVSLWITSPLPVSGSSVRFGLQRSVSLVLAVDIIIIYNTAPVGKGPPGVTLCGFD